MGIAVTGASKSKSVPAAFFKDLFERILYEAYKEAQKIINDKTSQFEY
jgi:hypothetical protein